MGSGQYFEVDPVVASRLGRVELRLADRTVSLTVDRGVFSAGRVDAGTMALLRASAPPPKRGHVVDLGCGYGPIACTLARRSPQVTVWAVDVNRRALALTATNADALGLVNVRPVLPDDVPPGLTIAGLWSNPPIRVGKDALHEMLGTWLGRLDEHARAWLVVHRHLGGDSLAAWMGGQGYTVRRAGSKQGYRILDVVRTVDAR
ncbi:MAG: methyltransferase [Actinomycetota bacterium]|nr:methyltransferase [Actinomycetota bacterium]MDQ6945709.1 methyltransferase [Actinomycetota bacterium]